MDTSIPDRWNTHQGSRVRLSQCRHRTRVRAAQVSMYRLSGAGCRGRALFSRYADVQMRMGAPNTIAYLSLHLPLVVSLERRYAEKCAKGNHDRRMHHCLQRGLDHSGFMLFVLESRI